MQGGVQPEEQDVGCLAVIQAVTWGHAFYIKINFVIINHRRSASLTGTLMPNIKLLFRLIWLLSEYATLEYGCLVAYSQAEALGLPSSPSEQSRPSPPGVQHRQTLLWAAGGRAEKCSVAPCEQSTCLLCIRCLWCSCLDSGSDSSVLVLIGPSSVTPVSSSLTRLWLRG